MSLSHSPSIVMSDLVLYLDAANIKSYSGSGTTWNTLSSTPATITVQNLSSGTVSGTNSYITFSATSATDVVTYYQITGTSITSNTINLTLEACINIDNFFASAGQPTECRPISPRTFEGNSPIGFGIRNGIISAEINTTDVIAKINGWFTSATANTACTTGTWIYVSQVTDDSAKTLRTFVNGSLVSTITYTGTPRWSPGGEGFLIGRGFYGGTLNYSGKVAFVRFYNRTLTDAELLQNFNALRGRFDL